MYSLKTPLSTVTGIGPKIAQALADEQLFTVQDLLLRVPFRYEDRSVRKTIGEIQAPLLNSTETSETPFVTLSAFVEKKSNRYLGRRSIQTATVSDETGKLAISWFNNPFVIEKLRVGEEFLFSGKVSVKGKFIGLTQPTVEKASGETIHTDRLVPIYSNLTGIKPLTLRRILKHICDHVQPENDPVQTKIEQTFGLLSLSKALPLLHFPDSEELIIQARERLAIEELLSIIQVSHRIKNEWRKNKTSITVQYDPDILPIPTTIPFELTASQTRSIREILADISDGTPMNRLLIGDVGSGKTIVAGVALAEIVKAGFTAAFIAPTQMLAEQHLATFKKLFPEIEVELITGKTSKKVQTGKGKQEEQSSSTSQPNTVTAQPPNHTPKLFIGTHAVLNYLNKNKEDIQVGLIVFDEQHRFGVNQRSSVQELHPHPHILTMTATPIPRSLTLTLFSHLTLSTIDELPKNRVPTKSHLVSEAKRQDMLNWIGQQISPAQPPNRPTAQPPKNFLTLYICPFIDPSNSKALENVASAKKKFEELSNYFSTLQIQQPNSATTRSPVLELLHGRQKVREKEGILKKLYAGEIDILVTTPIVEVGVDLPQASAIIIEASERFGLASLHQLRGRVGRAGQQGYCYLLHNTTSPATIQRLKTFCETLHGQKLAEMDLARRGAGELFGTQQHGFDELQFASWTDLHLIKTAQQITIFMEQESIAYQPIFHSEQSSHTPLAN